MEDESTREKFGSTLFFGVTLVPAMIVAGFMPEWNVLPLWQWGAIAAVGGGITGAIWAEGREFAGGLAGFLSGVGVIVALIAYVHARSSLSNTYHSVELLIPAALGMLPGWLVLKLAERLRSPGEVLHPPGEDETD